MLHTWILSPAVGAGFVLVVMGITSVRHKEKAPFNFDGSGSFVFFFTLFDSEKQGNCA